MALTRCAAPKQPASRCGIRPSIALDLERVTLAPTGSFLHWTMRPRKQLVKSSHLAIAIAGLAVTGCMPREIGTAKLVDARAGSSMTGLPNTLCTYRYSDVRGKRPKPCAPRTSTSPRRSASSARNNLRMPLATGSSVQSTTRAGVGSDQICCSVRPQ